MYEDKPLTINSGNINRAAFAGDLDKVRSLIDSGVDPNLADENGAGTLLTFHPSMISLLIENGADPNSQTNENGASVLAGLCYVGKIECVKLLLQYGANPNLGRRDSLETPLHHVLANAGSLELVSLLVKHGADVNAQTEPGVKSFNYYGDTPTRGETPLHRAAAYASKEVIQLLLDSGADRSLCDANRNTPCHWAGWHMRSKDIVEMLSTE